MAQFISIQVHKANEDIVKRIQTHCESVKDYPNFNALMNAIFPNLEEAIKSYNPNTRRVNLNLGNVTIR